MSAKLIWAATVVFMFAMGVTLYLVGLQAGCAEQKKWDDAWYAEHPVKEIISVYIGPTGNKVYCHNGDCQISHVDVSGMVMPACSPETRWPEGGIVCEIGKDCTIPAPPAKKAKPVKGPLDFKYENDCPGCPPYVENLSERRGYYPEPAQPDVPAIKPDGTWEDVEIKASYNWQMRPEGEPPIPEVAYFCPKGWIVQGAFSYMTGKPVEEFGGVKCAPERTFP